MLNTIVRMQIDAKDTYLTRRRVSVTERTPGTLTAPSKLGPVGVEMYASETTSKKTPWKEESVNSNFHFQEGFKTTHIQHTNDIHNRKVDAPPAGTRLDVQNCVLKPNDARWPNYPESRGIHRDINTIQDSTLWSK